MKTYIKLTSLALFAICLAASCIKEPKPVKVSSVTVSPASSYVMLCEPHNYTMEFQTYDKFLTKEDGRSDYYWTDVIASHNYELDFSDMSGI